MNTVSEEMRRLTAEPMSLVVVMLHEEEPGNVMTKLCIFACGRAATSDEHVWEQWMSSLYDPGTFHIERRVRDGAREWPTRKLNVTVNRVCRECNCGWIERLGDKVKPRVSPMVTGEATLSNPLTLSLPQQKAIATWATVRAMVWEFTGNPEAVYFTDDHRRYVRDKGRPPDPIGVWLARFPEKQFGSAGQYPILRRVPGYRHPAYLGLVMNLHLGHFILQVIAFREPWPARIPNLWLPKTVQIWPLERPVVWPPQEDLDLDTFVAFAARWAA